VCRNRSVTFLNLLIAHQYDDAVLVSSSQTLCAHAAHHSRAPSLDFADLYSEAECSRYPINEFGCRVMLPYFTQ
jgi:hypothetical protein